MKPRCLFVSVYVLFLLNSCCLTSLNVNCHASLWLQVATFKRHVALWLHLSCQVTSDRQTNTNTHSQWQGCTLAGICWWVMACLCFIVAFLCHGRLRVSPWFRTRTLPGVHKGFASLQLCVCVCVCLCVCVKQPACVCMSVSFAQINRWATGWLCCQLLLSHTHLHQVN